MFTGSPGSFRVYCSGSGGRKRERETATGKREEEIGAKEQSTQATCRPCQASKGKGRIERTRDTEKKGRERAKIKGKKGKKSKEHRVEKRGRKTPNGRTTTTTTRATARANNSRCDLVIEGLLCFALDFGVVCLSICLAVHDEPVPRTSPHHHIYKT